MKSFSANPRLHEDITYDFTNGKLITSGASFSEEKDLKKIFMIQETKQWFIFYEEGNVFNTLSKKGLSSDEVTVLRELIGNLAIAGTKKLRK